MAPEPLPRSGHNATKGHPCQACSDVLFADSTTIGAVFCRSTTGRQQKDFCEPNVAPERPFQPLILLGLPK
jgi:hypothetical protein